MIRSALFAILVAGFAVSAAADDRHVGYYFPEITSSEVFDRALGPRQATREARIELALSITRAQLDAPDNPRFSMFTKGAAAEKLIIVALDDEVFATLFRARAQMAQLTANIRDTDFFRNAGLAADITFYDLLYMMNFDTLTLSDGATWTHRVTFKPAE
ncbi:MAG: hypothetical protein AAGD12_12110 [Pseudomonadota bacterium]